MNEKIFFTVKSNYYEILSFIIDELHEYQVKKDIVKKIHIIVEEIITNIINYAYNYDYIENKDYVKISICFQKNEVKLCFTDSGIPYDFNGINNGPMKEKQVGGLGIYFIKTLSDATNFKRENGKNKLEVMIKNVL